MSGNSSILCVIFIVHSPLFSHKVEILSVKMKLSYESIMLTETVMITTTVKYIPIIVCHKKNSGYVPKSGRYNYNINFLLCPLSISDCAD